MKYYKDRKTALRLMGKQDFEMFYTELADSDHAWLQVIKEKLKSIETFFSNVTGEDFGNLKLPTSSNKQGTGFTKHRTLYEIHESQSDRELSIRLALAYKGISGSILHFNRRDDSIHNAECWLLTKDKKWYCLELSVNKTKHDIFSRARSAFKLEYAIKEVHQFKLEERDYDTKMLQSISISLSQAIIDLHKRKARQEHEMSLHAEKYHAIDSLICSSSNINTDDQEKISALYVR